MKRFFEYICIPLMLINNNAYTFISGILLSLSTGMVTTLGFEKAPFLESWHLYASSVVYIISGAILIYVAARITVYQDYICTNKILDRKAQREIITDFEVHRYRFWFFIFLALFFTLTLGTILLFLNYYI